MKTLTLSRSGIVVALLLVVTTLCGLPMIVLEVFAQPLTPSELAARPTAYKATEQAGERQTREAEFAKPGVLILDTPSAAGARTATSGPRALPKAVTLTPAPTQAFTQAVTIPPPRLGATGVISGPQLGNGTRIPVVSSVTPSPNSTPRGDLPRAMTATPLPAINVTDIISNEVASAQAGIEVAKEGLPIQNMMVRFSPKEVRLDGQMTAPGPIGPIVITGTLFIENEGLQFSAKSLRVAGADWTNTAYRGQVERMVSSSLYRLLPTRHVQSFVLGQDTLTVNSYIQPR